MLRAYHPLKKKTTQFHLISSGRFRYQSKVTSQVLKKEQENRIQPYCEYIKYSKHHVSHQTFTVQLQRLSIALSWHFCFSLTNHPLISLSVSICILPGRSGCVSLCSWSLKLRQASFNSNKAEKIY